MKVILFTDPHFGVKNGSMTWFRSQKSFIYEQLIPYIKQEDAITICLGDVFDSRQAVPTIIGHEVKKMFIDIGKASKGFYVIQGNHDNGSPVDRTYNTLELVLGGIDCVKLVSCTQELDIDDKHCILLPWFDQAQSAPEGFTQRYKDSYIFTHADIITGSPRLHTPVFSGHIHTPYINGNIRNLGSCFPLTFADANAQRYFYVWDAETDSLSRIPNGHSIRFWRIYNEDILTKDWSKCGQNDYIECYIKYSLLQDPEYQGRCKSLQLQFKNYRTIPLPDELAQGPEVVECDIESIIDQMVPDYLAETFNKIKDHVNSKQEPGC